jgi:NADH-quinone oxidoreductase subunit A
MTGTGSMPGTVSMVGTESRTGALSAQAEGLGSYASLGLLLAVGVLFFVVAMTANRLLRTTKPSVEKSSTYECGIDPVGGDWAQAQIRYYVYAYLYVLFAVEAVFLFPWAVIFDDAAFGIAAVVEMAIFVGVLALGLLYAWRKRVLSWT